MCLAVPSRIVSINGETGIIEADGLKRTVSLLLLEDPRVGEYVIVHAGFAIHKVDESAAQESLVLLREILELG
jgi:hydrogenase expression/formation protein HypC